MFRFKGYTLDIGCSTLRSGYRDLRLRPKSFEVLRYLIQNAGRVVIKEELISAVWPNLDDVVAHCVSEVRQAIGDDNHHQNRASPRLPVRGTHFTLRSECRGSTGTVIANG